MDAPIGTEAQQTALRNIVAMLTIADSGVNDARRIARYIDSMNNEDELKMALSIAIGMLHSAIEDRAALGGHTVADYLRIAGMTAAHEGR